MQLNWWRRLRETELWRRRTQISEFLKKPWKILRWLFGGYYLGVGILFGLTMLGVLRPPKLAISPGSAAFQQALAATGFVMPVLVATYIAG